MCVASSLIHGSNWSPPSSTPGDSVMLSAAGKFWPPLSRCETHTSNPPFVPVRLLATAYDSSSSLIAYLLSSCGLLASVATTGVPNLSAIVVRVAVRTRYPGRWARLRSAAPVARPRARRPSRRRDGTRIRTAAPTTRGASHLQYGSVRRVFGIVFTGLGAQAGALEQLVQELALQAGDPGRLGQVASGSLHEVCEVLALEPRDERVLRGVERLIGLERDVLARGRGDRRAQHERQRLKVIVGTGERDRARDHVAELAHVARPMVVLEPRERRPAGGRRERRRTGAVQKHRDQVGEVFLALA